MVDLTSKGLFDWFSQIIIPLFVGAAIPFVIWWFSAERAEKKKQKEDLQNALDFLTSISLFTLTDLLRIKGIIEARIPIISRIMSKAVQPENISDQDILDFAKQTKAALGPIAVVDAFYSISPEKYSPAIKQYENLVIDILRIKRDMQLMSDRFRGRDREIEMLGTSILSNSAASKFPIFTFLIAEQENLPFWRTNICYLIFNLDDLLNKVHEIGTAIKVKLDPAKFSKEQEDQINAIKNEIKNMGQKQ
jgi:hypothetical protein